MVIDIERTIEELRTQARQDEPFVESGALPEFDLMLEVLRTLHLELHLDVPNVDALKGLLADALSHHNRIFREAIKDINQGRLTTVFGSPNTMAKIRSVFDSLASEIVQLANQRTDEFNRLAAAATAAAKTIDTQDKAKDDTQMTDLTRQEVDAKLAANKAEVAAQLANFDASIKTGFADLRAEFAELRAEMAKQSGDMRTEMANVRTDTQKSATEVTRWVVGFGIAILGAVLTLAKVGDKPAAAPVAQPAPIIITVPASAPAPSAATPQK